MPLVEFPIDCETPYIPTEIKKDIEEKPKFSPKPKEIFNTALIDQLNKVRKQLKI